MRDIDKTREQLIDELVQLRKLTKTLKTNNDNLSTAINRVTDAFSALDNNWKIIYVNKNAEKLYHKSKEELAGKYFWDVFPKTKNRTMMYNLIQESMDFQINLSKEITNVNNEKWFEVRTFPSNDGVSIFSTEITERKLIEQELKHSHELFRKAFNLSPSPMSITSIDDGTIIQANEIFLETFGYNREEINSLSILNLYFNPEQRNKLIKELFHNGYYKNIEMELKVKSGNKKIVLLSANLIRFNCKLCVLETAHDITHIKQAEFEQRRLQARLDSLNLVGQMAAGIGHEIRNPMTTVRGFLQLFSANETDSEKKGYYEIMIEELDRANSIITEFLSLAKDRVVELQPTSLNSIIGTLFPLLKSDAVKEDNAIVFNKGDIPNIPLNEKEIQQLVINLVRNAIEASPPSGVITLSTYVSENEVVLSVEDEGIGIPAEVIDKLGTPFVTTKDNGIGLGISVCYSIAHKHNAKIDVKTGSTGTTFYVRFKIPQTQIKQVS
ncbi:PAS domain S-box protein [Phosphitispora sp. TUW77]|uniref:PAS domain S-box protein n=1 Tax=Phosphitispora sp. TUW77 TaxID=3152361 RepID=UPI003AB4F079